MSEFSLQSSSSQSGQYRYGIKWNVDDTWFSVIMIFYKNFELKSLESNKDIQHSQRIFQIFHLKYQDDTIWIYYLSES